MDSPVAPLPITLGQSSRRGAVFVCPSCLVLKLSQPSSELFFLRVSSALHTALPRRCGWANDGCILEQLKTRVFPPVLNWLDHESINAETVKSRHSSSSTRLNDFDVISNVTLGIGGLPSRWNI
jgi:hypothetical protein